MNEVDSLSELSDTSLLLNSAVMSVIVKKLDAITSEDEFRRLLVSAFNTLVSCLDQEKLPIAGGAQVNLLAIALDNKLDIVNMIADATRMRDSFTKEMERRSNASS